MITPGPPTPRMVVLAAGFSARLGKPKALARIHGVSLLDRTLAVLAPLARAAKIIVVIPPGSSRYRSGSGTRSAVFAANPGRSTGLSSSVRLGITRARCSAAVLLLPVDLAQLDRRDLARLISRWRGARRSVVARRAGARAATPLILPRWLYARGRSVTGDAGLRDLVRQLPTDRVLLMDLPSAAADVDTVHDLEHARRRVIPARTRYR